MDTSDGSGKDQFSEFSELMARIKQIRNSINSNPRNTKVEVEENVLQNKSTDSRHKYNGSKEQIKTLDIVPNMTPISNSLEEIKQLDNLLQQSEVKVKGACEVTFLAQRQSRQELETARDNCANNTLLTEHSETFRRLCCRYINQVKDPGVNDCETSNGDTDELNPKDVPRVESATTDKIAVEEEREKQDGTESDTKLDKEPASAAAGVTKKKSQDFILRNKELVSGHGVGTMAITCQEKERLDALLEGDDEDNAAEERDARLGYAMSNEEEQFVTEIDSKLEMMSSGLSSCMSAREGDKEGDPSATDDRRKAWKEIHLQQRLSEINKSLSLLNRVDPQVVDPIDEDDLQQLIVEICKPSSGSASASETTLASLSGAHLPSLASTVGSIASCNDTSQLPVAPAVSCQVMSQLLEDARSKMPRFKYRHATELQ